MKASAERQNALFADKIAIVRGGALLFEGLSFTVAAGGALLVTGRNGAGKSSLLRAIAGMLPFAAGEWLNPFSLAWAGGEPALKPEQRVGAELRFWSALDGASNERRREAIDMMGIGSLLDLPAGVLSSGQRQRVSLARLVGSGADLWLLDEPTNALDTVSTERLLMAIARHRANGGLVIAATHQPLPLPDATTLHLG